MMGFDKVVAQAKAHDAALRPANQDLAWRPEVPFSRPGIFGFSVQATWGCPVRLVWRQWDGWPRDIDVPLGPRVGNPS